MNKITSKRILSFIIALMMLMPGFPSSLVNAEELPDSNNEIQNVVAPVTTDSAIEGEIMMEPMLLATNEYESEAGVMNALGQSTNNHLIGYLAWTGKNTEDLYIAFNISKTAVDKTLFEVIYNDVSAGLDYKEIENAGLIIDGHTYTHDFPNWLVINLGRQTLTDPFYIGLDYAENGFDALGNDRIKIDLEEYTVTYNPNGGTGILTDTNNPYIEDDTVTVLENTFTNGGYDFVSWNTKADGSGDTYYPDDTFTMLAHDVVLYAQWSIGVYRYRVEYYQDSLTGTLLGTDNFTATYGDVITDEDIDLAKYVPTGYATPGTSDGPLTITEVEANNVIKVYYVKDEFGYRVEYYQDSLTGTLLETDNFTAEFGEVITDADIDLTTYAPTGYATHGTSDGPLTITEIESNNVIKVYYVKDEFDYTVEYYQDSLTGTLLRTDNFTAEFGDVITDADIDLTAYAPTGYATPGTSDGPLTITEVEANNVIKVYYEKRNDLSYTINYYKDAVTNTEDAVNSLGTETVNDMTYMAEVTLTDTQLNAYRPVTGYQSGVQQGTVPFMIHEEGNVINVLYNKTNNLNVYYYPNGGYGTMIDESNPYDYGETVTVLTNLFTRSNYRFTGWNTAVDGTGTSYAEGATFTMPASNVTLYAQWRRRTNPNPPIIIEEPKVPLADLEKLDHFAYIIGYLEGDIKPLNNITREEVAMIFYRLLTDESRNKLLSDSNTFIDMVGHEWSNRAISTLYNAGIIVGYPDGTFKPSDPISRAEFATIAAKFDKLEYNYNSKFNDIAGHWAEKYINSSELKGWIKGYEDNTFRPDIDITRAESMTLINNVLSRIVKGENIHPDAIKWPDNQTTAWYYEAVEEATNSHAYVIDENKQELWTGLKANKVWP